MGMTLAEYEAHVPTHERIPANGWVDAVSIERRSCPGCGQEFWAHHGMLLCGDEECRRKYQSRQSSETIMRRYHADPAFRAEILFKAHNRRAGKLGLEGITTRENLIALLYKRDRALCGICGGEVVELTGPMRPSIDHTIPVSRGGPHALHNLQLAHYRCNLSKHDNLPPAEIVEVVCLAHEMLTGQDLFSILTGS
jgi:5-methylcytosine-specific restriction endonuclease McrA